MNYIVKFDRVGRRRGVEPMTFEDVEHPDELAALIYERVRPMLASREVEVFVNLIQLTGRIVVGGMRAAGDFTIKAVNREVTA